MIYNSRRMSDNLNRMSKKEKARHAKISAASFEKYYNEKLMPFEPSELVEFITITGWDKYYREVKYCLNIPDELVKLRRKNNEIIE